MSHSIMKIDWFFFKNIAKHFCGFIKTQNRIHGSFPKTNKVEYEFTTGMPKSITRLCLQVKSMKTYSQVSIYMHKTCLVTYCFWILSKYDTSFGMTDSRTLFCASYSR